MSTRRTLTVKCHGRSPAEDIRDNIEDIWTEWFDLAVTTAANIGVVPSIPRRTNQQQHRDNVPAQTSSDYHKRAVANPLLDHLESEMKTYFNPTNDAVLSSLFNLLTEVVAVGDRNSDIGAALEFYENDLPSPYVVDVELLRWKRKVVWHWGCRPSQKCSSDIHSQHAIESSFLTSTP